jgi:hypothetical protein
MAKPKLVSDSFALWVLVSKACNIQQFLSAHLDDLSGKIHDF